MWYLLECGRTWDSNKKAPTFQFPSLSLIATTFRGRAIFYSYMERKWEYSELIRLVLATLPSQNHSCLVLHHTVPHRLYSFRALWVIVSPEQLLWLSEDGDMSHMTPWALIMKTFFGANVSLVHWSNVKGSQEWRSKGKRVHAKAQHFYCGAVDRATDLHDFQVRTTTNF